MKYARVEISPRSGSRRLVLGLREAVLLLTAGFAGLAGFSDILGTPSSSIAGARVAGANLNAKDRPPRDLRAGTPDTFDVTPADPSTGRREVRRKNRAASRRRALLHRWRRCLDLRE